MFGKKGQDIVVTSCVYNCLKEKCPLWAVLNTTYQDEKTGEPKVKSEGRCSIAWLPTLLVELRQAIDKK
jgi:hypothetical protein